MQIGLQGWTEINIREVGEALLGPAAQAEKNNERLNRWCIIEYLLSDVTHARDRSSFLPSPTSTCGSFNPYSAVGLLKHIVSLVSIDFHWRLRNYHKEK